MFIFTLVMFALALTMAFNHVIEFYHHKPDDTSYLDLDDKAKWGDFMLIIIYLVIAYIAFKGL